MKIPLMKRGQDRGYAVPLILLGFLGVFLLYIILVYPSERAKLLNIDTDNGEEVSPLGEGTEVLYSSGERFEVGRAVGSEVFSWKLNNAIVSHAAVPKTLDSTANRVMSATLVSSDTESFSANNLNLANTKDVVVKLNIESIKGNPKIQIILNKTMIYEKAAAAGETNIRIQPGLLDEDSNPIYVKVLHQGAAFWSVQSVSFNSINIDQYYYDPENSISPQNVIISENNYRGSRVNLIFNVTSAVTDGELNIAIQKPGAAKTVVWSGAPELGVATASFDIDQIGIGENIISFEAKKGGEYAIANTTLKFFAESQPPAIKTYSFDIEASKLYSGRVIMLGVKVDRIIEPGSLFFTVGASPLSYYFPSADIASGAWSYTQLDKGKLKELGNKIILDSVNGRFSISGLMIILK
ncbi:MAG: hypothetical protein PHC66_01655 [Candidatus Nanoarchaeia archaeon]|nr:hypothetical protein [Candidatus Nanoarchaeia archaeon]MDD5238917.1 hypothetical protein [Candidatus Nanoarchaeia archaeon]